MTTSPERRTGISPSAVATTTSSSASASLAEAASPSPYFLPELIPLVASRLTTLQDFFALRAACRTYRALLTPSSSSSQAPRLLVTHKASASESLFHAPLRRLLRFSLPCTRRDLTPTRFYAFGCRLAIYHRIKGFLHTRELRISHLRTGQQARLPDPPKDFDGVIFAGDLVLAFKGFSSVLWYCRIGDVRWRAASCHQGFLFYRLVVVKDTLYGLMFPNYSIAVVQLQLRTNSVNLLFLGDDFTSLSVQDCSPFWLGIAECRDELLLVVAVQFRPLVYHVFRWQSQENKWARITSLGGYSLFFHNHQFAGCLGPDHPTVRRDCMYFTSCTGHWREYCLVDGAWRYVAHNLERAAIKDYIALAWALPSSKH